MKQLMLTLMLLMAFCAASLPQLDHATLVAWIASPAVTIGLVLLIGAVFYHAQLGLQVILEDYVSTHWRRTAAIVLTSFACLLMAAIGVVSVLKIAFGAA